MYNVPLYAEIMFNVDCWNIFLAILHIHNCTKPQFTKSISNPCSSCTANRSVSKALTFEVCWSVCKPNEIQSNWYKATSSDPSVFLYCLSMKRGPTSHYRGDNRVVAVARVTPFYPSLLSWLSHQHLTCTACLCDFPGLSCPTAWTMCPFWQANAFNHSFITGLRSEGIDTRRDQTYT